MMNAIIRKETNDIQRLHAIRESRNQRHRHQEFIIEGTIAIDEAVKNNWPLKRLFYTGEKSLSSWAKKHIAALEYLPCIAVTSDIMATIADKNNSPELILIGASKKTSFHLYQPQNDNEVIVVLDQPKSAGNLGMIIRSASAFNITNIIISGHGADEYDPKCIRSSVGGFFSTNIYRTDGVASFRSKIAALKLIYGDKFSVHATGERGNQSLHATKFGSGIQCIVLGNETSGISHGYQEIADSFIHIPLTGKLHSLNIGAAASIFFYEIMTKQKHFSNMG